MALSGVWAGGTRWGCGFYSIAPAGGCCQVRSGKTFWGNVLLAGGLSFIWLLQGLRPARNLGHLRASQGPGALAHPGINPPVLLSQLCLSTSKPLWNQLCAGPMLAFAITEGAGGCAPSSTGWADGVPQSCKATLGTPEDVALCHHHPAPTWQETLLRGKPGVDVPQQPCCCDSKAHRWPPPLTSFGQGPWGPGAPTATHPPTSTIPAALCHWHLWEC